MAEWLQDVRSLARTLVVKLQHLLAEAPAGSLQLTGVLGLAALVWGLYQLRAPGRRDDNAGPQDLNNRRGPNSTGSLMQQPKQAQSSSTAQQTKSAAPTSLSQAIQTQLAGVRQITISAPGVLLDQWTPDQLQDSASVRQAVVPILPELAKHANVFLITHVIDDVGEATVRGALEDVGLVGPSEGQIKSHRLVFCSTLEGKVSIVRQLEPELHIDGHPTTVEDLKRFMPQILHIVPSGSQPAAVGNKNVGSAGSLAEVFSFSVVPWICSTSWLGVLKQHCVDLDVGLAQEHQHRVRQEREKALLQQAFRKDAKRREWQQHEARLVRVAALDDAALFHSTHSAKQHQTLKSQLRQSLQLAAC